MREGAWVGRAPAGSGSGRHVEEWGCWRLERRGEPLCCAADSPSSKPARGGEPRPVSLVRWRRSVHRRLLTLRARHRRRRLRPRRRQRLLGHVERGARRLRSRLASTTITAATVGAFARALRGRVLTSCRGCRRCSSDEGRGKGCSGDGRGGEARPATGLLPPPTASGPCTRRRLAAAFPCLRATRWGSRPKRARL